MSQVILRALAVWILLAVVAVLNGTARNAWIAPRLGEQRAHIVSTFILCALIFFIVFALIRWIGITTPTQASLLGLCWVAMTLAFEFLAGHFLFGHPWERLVADYNVLSGRLWILVPIVTYLAPRWALRLRVL